LIENKTLIVTIGNKTVHGVRKTDNRKELEMGDKGGKKDKANNEKKIAKKQAQKIKNIQKKQTEKTTQG